MVKFKRTSTGHTKTERELFLEAFPKTYDGKDKSYTMEYSLDGKILKIETTDLDIIKFCKALGLTSS